MNYDTRQEKQIKALKITNLLNQATEGQKAQFLDSLLVNLSMSKLNQSLKDLKRLQEYNKIKQEEK